MSVLDGVTWRGHDVYLGEDRMEMTKLVETPGSVVHKARLRDCAVVVKRFKHPESIEYETELRIIARTKQESALARLFVAACPTNRSSIVMEACDGDLSALNWSACSAADIRTALRRLCQDLQIMVSCNVYYTDLKLQNVVFKRSNGGVTYKWGDFSSVASHNWSTQTYPYPTPTYDFRDYDNTFMPACERVLVWGLGIMWCQMLGHERLCVEYLCFNRLTRRSLRAFKFALFKHKHTPPALRNILELKVHTLHEFLDSTSRGDT